MGDKHRVRFEPVDIEIEVDEDETILDAAFRQGVMLMHGCKEGQCSACKSFLLDGDLQMERYSTFALADYESEEGYVLLCRGHAYSDLEVELINYDEDMIRAGVPIQLVNTEVAAIEELTHDIVHLRLTCVSPRELAFNPGQYADVRIPGTEHWRSFSMANTPSTDHQADFVIKRYPGGHFSGLLDGGLSVGDALDIKGPYGTFTLRESDRDLVMIGGGAGMAPILSLLTHLREQGIDRRTTFYYGGRTARDLFYLDRMDELSEVLSRFSFVAALSEETGVAGAEEGLITDVVDRLETDLSGADAYLCGPPPMVEAAIELMAAKGVPEGRVFYDKFTTTASADEPT
ncbi:FAD-binding oxidoreductase [Actinoallomurus bryophytorum]|uniref:Propane monooxygenase reductase subunit n=1 Tax=Actinoallomurus bryophytorum TaxID=1490222 RepID=A0A543C1M8_9ACTN|nr:2Fe-2S iron-sulfur cluster binding domain-containing protein [Actinoallomurus bryophytorum]TQL90980.1 propane monooxygenase reductase subunit [Actinoallomurus bryophytorum]